MRQYVIVGNGVAGHRAAVELRRLDNDAAITLIGSDTDLPYDRPSLTKDFLLGHKDATQIVLKDALDYAQHRIAYMPGTIVDVIDAGNRRVTIAGREHGYDALLLATGSRPRLLPKGLDAGNGFYLRSLADARQLSEALRPGLRVVVIGGGFIGLEVAAAARIRGCAVTVAEARSSVLSRGLPPVIGRFMAGLHQDNGITIICDATVTSLDWTGPTARITVNGSVIEADIVVYGLGVEPNTELAERIGLRLDDGIVVDTGCRTSDPAIFAAGEVTSHPSGRSGARRRIESWRVSSEQPLVAAANMTGGASTYVDAAWLWSDQFDVNLQCLGDVSDGAAYMLRGAVEERKWTLIALDKAGLPVGAVAVNNGRDISMLRRAINTGAPLPTALAADASPFDADENSPVS